MGSKTPYQLTRQVTLLSVLINTLLGGFKILIGFFGHSQALLADGVHSLSDLLTDALVLFAAKASNQGPDQNHPYGHGRIETFFVILLAVFLVVLGLGIAADASFVIFKKKVYDIPDGLVLVMAIISILANEGLFRFMRQIGRAIHSNLLMANAWHHRSDAYSSLIVLIGAGGTMLGIHFLDALAAIIVAVMIIKMGISMAWQSVRELVDTGLDEAEVSAIIEMIKKIDGVEAVHQLRSRALAGRFFLDVHVQVNAFISASEGHYIADKVYRQVKGHFKQIKDITVHIDPEDDEKIKPSDSLPSRVNIEELLKKYCGQLKGFEKIISINLDYLEGKIYIQLSLPLDLLGSIEEGEHLQQAYQKSIKSVHDIAHIILTFQPGS